VTLRPDGFGGITAKQACTVLYDRLPPLRSEILRSMLQANVGPCVVEWAEANNQDVPMVGGMARFGQHTIIMIALNAPVRRELLERTVAVSPMPDELRREMLAHGAAIRLLYTGDAEAGLEQLTALYRVAGALLAQGGIGLLNERAALAMPAELATQYLADLDGLSPPIPLWVGAVTFHTEDAGASRPYLMRTYGMEQLGLPELCIYMQDRTLADNAYHTLMNICLYIAEGGPALRMGVGDRADFNGRTYLFTEPDGDREELAGPTGMLLLVEV